jgi:hypothetical protein
VRIGFSMGFAACSILATIKDRAKNRKGNIDR